MQREPRNEQDLKLLLSILQSKLGEGFHVKSDRDGEKTVFTVKKEGEDTRIVLYPESLRVRWLLIKNRMGAAAALLEREYKKKYQYLSKRKLIGGSFPEVKGQIIFSLESRAEYKDILPHIPHQPVMEMEMIYRLIAKRKKEFYYRIINNDDLKEWGIEQKELFDIARNNTPMLFPAYAMTLADATGVWDIRKQRNCKLFFRSMKNMKKAKENDFPVIALLSHFNSASCIMYEGHMEYLANIWDDHVVLLIGTNGDCFLCPFEAYNQRLDITDGLKKEIKRANKWQKPFLTDHVYLYDREEKIFRILCERTLWDQILVL